MSRGRHGELDAVTLDAFGTLLELADPLPAIEEALRARGSERSREEIARAFAAENRYYRANTIRGRDATALGELYADCAGVFLSTLGLDLDRHEFAPAYVDAMRFELIEGVIEPLQQARDRGLRLAVVANWEITLHDWLERLGIAGYFSAVVTAAEAGAAKPDPAIFTTALQKLGAAPGRALHIGDDEVDERGARAAGMHFAYAPVGTALGPWL